ncbi:hypothetical protein [Shewanella sp. YLB-07]|uniref:hypothetical protein n=1 Tax=Shewanella sp. YLB-07 TaxID=2601268 RepID=UPI00128B3B29|nr:hypothetical protein [Shewanella sp. YLB-07]MPY24428.1 hypothetical protein [Shewanella sp. YLB-07]
MKTLQPLVSKIAPQIATDLNQGLKQNDEPKGNEVTQVIHGVDCLRELLDRSCVASRYCQLSDQQKAMILYGAKLKPSTHINTPLDSMTIAEREQIRQSIIALCDISDRFGRTLLTRDRFDHKPKGMRLSTAKSLIQEAKDRH